MKHFIETLTKSVVRTRDNVLELLETQKLQGEAIVSLSHNIAKLQSEWSGEPMPDLSEFTDALDEHVEAVTEIQVKHRNKKKNNRYRKQPGTTGRRSAIRWGTKLQKVWCYLNEASPMGGLTNSEINSGMGSISGSSIFELKKRGYIVVTNPTADNRTPWKYTTGGSAPAWVSKPA